MTPSPTAALKQVRNTVSSAQAREGVAQVPGAHLRYRLAGRTDNAPLLVFENGWGASYEQWAWIERKLAGQAQLLFYNRAGIGGSELLAPQTVQGLSAQFAALIEVLELAGPVVAVGHSFGGLMCSLHASQARASLRTVVEIDSTPQVADSMLDGNLGSLGLMVKLVKLCVKLGLPNILFGALEKTLPPALGQEMMRRSLNNPASLDASLAEMALLGDIRSTIARGRPQDFSRLFIGAETKAEGQGLLTRLMMSPKRIAETIARGKQLQLNRAKDDPGCRVMRLPFDHSGLVFDPAGASATVAALLAYVREVGS